MIRSPWSVVIRPTDAHSAALMYLEIDGEVLLDNVSGELEAIATEYEAEMQRLLEKAERMAREQREAELAELDKQARPELESLLADAGPLETLEQLDAFRERLADFRSRFADTKSAQEAQRESDALAGLRLGYQQQSSSNFDSKRWLQKVVDQNPGTLAAEAAEARLSVPAE
ncbi:MAG: hypothetical protein WBC44_03805 [Planctomycetaceae bacterium]